MTEVCKCHGVPKAKPRGCRVTKRANHRRNLLTEKGRARARRFHLAETVRRREDFIQRTEEELRFPSTAR